MARKQPRKNRNRKNGLLASTSHLLAGLNMTFQKAYKTGQWIKALEIAEEMTKQQPADSLGWRAKADAYARLKRFKDAVSCMEYLEKITNQFSVSDQLKLAQYQVLGGFALDAMPALLKLSAQYDERADIHLWLSQAYHALGKNDLALNANDVAIKLDRNNVDVLLWRSRILDNLRQPSDAKKHCSRLKS